MARNRPGSKSRPEVIWLEMVQGGDSPCMKWSGPWMALATEAPDYRLARLERQVKPDPAQSFPRLVWPHDVDRVGSCGGIIYSG